MNKEQRKLLISKQKFAALFLAEGAETYGDIDKSNQVLGSAWDLCDEDIRRFIAEEGKVVPACGETKVEVQANETFATADKPALDKSVAEREQAWRDADFTIPDPDAGKEEWCKKYRTLEPTINDIAIGKVKATAAQARLLSNIEQRCFGPIVKEQEKQVQSGVLLLPVIGSGSEMMICPRCGYVHQVSEEFEDETPVDE